MELLLLTPAFLPALSSVATLPTEKDYPVERRGKGVNEGEEGCRLRPWPQEKLREGEEKQENHWTLLLESTPPV